MVKSIRVHEPGGILDEVICDDIRVSRAPAGELALDYDLKDRMGGRLDAAPAGARRRRKERHDDHVLVAADDDGDAVGRCG